MLNPIRIAYIQEKLPIVTQLLLTLNVFFSIWVEVYILQ